MVTFVGDKETRYQYRIPLSSTATRVLDRAIVAVAYHMTSYTLFEVV
jgi:hypothetical protein